MWFRRAREREAARERFSAVADRIGAREGKVIRESFYGSLVISDGLSLFLIRPGPADVVAQAQIDAAVAAGYTWPPTPPCDSRSPCGFTQPPELPMLTIETFSAGSHIRGTGIKIPDGFTGLIINIG